MKQLLIFVLLITTFCWLMFSPVYKHVLVMRQALLQKEVDYMLEISANASYGYISSAMINDSRQRMEQRGFDESDLEYIIATTNGQSGVNPAQPVPRGEGLYLEIRYPMEDMLNIDELIGIDRSFSAAELAAQGMKMSEYVP